MKLQILCLTLIGTLVAERDIRKIDTSNDHLVNLVIDSKPNDHSASYILNLPDSQHGSDKTSQVHSIDAMKEVDGEETELQMFISSVEDPEIEEVASRSLDISSNNEPTYLSNMSNLPHEFARSGNVSVSFGFRKARNEALDDGAESKQDEEQLESLDDLFPESLVQTKTQKDHYSRDHDQSDYLTFSSVGDSTGREDRDDSFGDDIESLDDIEASELVGEGYDVEEVIESLDDLTAGALIANYLFEDDIEHPENTFNTSKLLKDNHFDLEKLLEGTGVNSSVLLSAVDTLKKAGGLQNLLKATKGSPLGMGLLAVGSPGASPRQGAPLGALGALSAGMSNLGTLGGAMKHQDMDEIRRELKDMLFGDEEKNGFRRNDDVQRRQFSRPQYSTSPSQQRMGQPHNKQVQGPPQRYGPPQHASNRDYKTSETRPRTSYPPVPPIPHNKNLDFGGYVRIHLPTIMAQIKGQQKKSQPVQSGYQKQGYYRNDQHDRNFRPSDQVDQKDNFKPMPPRNQPQNERSKFSASEPPKQYQRPQNDARPPFQRTDNRPARPQENPAIGSDSRQPQSGQRCDTFWEDVCMEVEGYPVDQIRSQFLKNKNAADTMLADVRRQSADNLVDGVAGLEERKYSYSHYYGNRRQGEGAHLHRDFANDGGYVCPSEIIYGRPKRAKNSRGEWKYIINFGDYTQTLRFEKCLKPGGSCSYLAPHFLSQCAQVYNYHRLLAWEEKSGLHVDIFKVPSGCSCHIAGYITSPQDDTPSSSRTTEKRRKSPKYREQESIVEVKNTPTVEEFDELGGSFGGIKSFSENFGNRFPERRSSDSEGQESKNVLKNVRSPPVSQQSPARIGTSSLAPAAPLQKPEIGGDKPKVNYGYHPIIDFFQNYRFTAAR